MGDLLVIGRRIPVGVAPERIGMVGHHLGMIGQAVAIGVTLSVTRTVFGSPGVGERFRSAKYPTPAPTGTARHARGKHVNGVGRDGAFRGRQCGVSLDTVRIGVFGARSMPSAVAPAHG